MTAACALTWLGLFDTPSAALESVAEKRGGLDADRACTPSQLRYVAYFGQLLEGVRPRAPGMGAAAWEAEASAAAGRAAAEAEMRGAPPPEPATTLPPVPAAPQLKRVTVHGVPDFTLSRGDWEAAHGGRAGGGAAVQAPVAGGGGEGEGEGGDGGGGGGGGKLSQGLASLASKIDALLITPVLGPAGESSGEEEEEAGGGEEAAARREARRAEREAARAARAAARRAGAGEGGAAAPPGEAAPPPGVEGDAAAAAAAPAPAPAESGGGGGATAAAAASQPLLPPALASLAAA